MSRKYFYLFQNYFSSLSQGHIQNFERNGTNSICIRVKNFAKSVNF